MVIDGVAYVEYRYSFQVVLLSWTIMREAERVLWKQNNLIFITSAVLLSSAVQIFITFAQPYSYLSVSQQ
jgi:hypothetical protein